MSAPAVLLPGSGAVWQADRPGAPRLQQGAESSPRGGPHRWRSHRGAARPSPCHHGTLAPSPPGICSLPCHGAGKSLQNATCGQKSPTPTHPSHGGAWGRIPQLPSPKPWALISPALSHRSPRTPEHRTKPPARAQPRSLLPLHHNRDPQHSVSQCGGAWSRGHSPAS